MKNLFFAAAAIAVLGLSSCAKDCVDCSGSAAYGSLGEVCKDSYTDPTGVLPWSTYRASLVTGGCK